jgi:hypothetical protein
MLGIPIKYSYYPKSLAGRITTPIKIISISVKLNDIPQTQHHISVYTFVYTRHSLYCHIISYINSATVLRNYFLWQMVWSGRGERGEGRSLVANGYTGQCSRTKTERCGD